MRNAHIAFFSFPHPAHVNPTIPIAAVLARRGYRVSYVTSDRFKSEVSATGAQLISCPPFNVRELHDFDPNSSDEPTQNPFFRLAAQTISNVTNFFESDRPALIIYDVFSLAGRILSRRLGVPAIQTSPALASSEKTYARPTNDPRYRQGMINESRAVDRFLESYGISSNTFLFHRENLNIYLFPSAFQPDADAYGDNCFHAGRCAGEQQYHGEWRKKNTENRPIALITTSTTNLQGPQYFRACIEALSESLWYVILSIGDNNDAGAFTSLPPHCEVVQRVSHLKILPYAHLLVCLGGIITLTEAGYHGVPVIVTTQALAELEWQADILDSLGLGIYIRGTTASADDVRKASTRILEDPNIFRRVAEMRRAIRREPGAEETANRIEEYMDTW